MEHILQFAVNIDDERIIQIAQDRAANEILKDVRERVNSYARGYNSRLELIYREEVKKVIDANKEEILADVKKTLASNLVKTKAVKEILENIKEGDI